MLAPEPFFEPRGTPFSEFHRIKALVEDGHAEPARLASYPRLLAARNGEED